MTAPLKILQSETTPLRTPREEIDRYLAENFKLTDRRGLLDEVYSSFED